MVLSIHWVSWDQNPLSFSWLRPSNNTIEPSIETIQVTDIKWSHWRGGWITEAGQIMTDVQFWEKKRFQGVAIEGGHLWGVGWEGSTVTELNMFLIPIQYDQTITYMEPYKGKMRMVKTHLVAGLWSGNKEGYTWNNLMNMELNRTKCWTFVLRSQQANGPKFVSS